MQEAEVPAGPLPVVDEDRRLVERAQAGDARAFEALVRRYERWVFTLALRMLGDRGEAEDAAQEAFLKAYRGLGAFQGASRFSTWLYAIASRHCLSCLEARGRSPHAQVGGGADAPGEGVPNPADRLPDGAPPADVLLERQDLARIVQAELATLTEEHRLILILREIQGMSYDEIAQALDLELGTVRSRLHRARMEMKARLTPHLTDGSDA